MILEYVGQITNYSDSIEKLTNDSKIVKQFKSDSVQNKSQVALTAQNRLQVASADEEATKSGGIPVDCATPIDVPDPHVLPLGQLHHGVY